MTVKPLTFRALATQDIDDITKYYDEETGRDVALRFADALEAAISVVSQRPGRWIAASGGCARYRGSA